MFQKRSILLLFVMLSLVLAFTLFVQAHGEEVQSVSQSTDWTVPTPYIIIVGIFLVIMTIFVTTFGKSISLKHKKFFFWFISTPIILVSVYLAAHTIYEISTSESRGPIHWHADYQVQICGERIDLIDPIGLRNKIGSPLFHEHNDDRIHIEGTVPYLEDVDLGSYFKVIGGELEQNPAHITYPTEEITYNYENGDLCQDRSVGTLKVYVNGQRISNYEEYLIYPSANVPPGDCIIIVFDDTTSETTDIVCDSWQVQGWTYDNYQRPSENIGAYSWN